MTAPLPRTDRPTARLRSRGVLLAVGAMALLAACSPMKAGSAAVVGTETLPESQVSDAFQEVADVAAAHNLTAPAATDLSLRLVGVWVEETLTEQLAAREGVTVSNGEVDTFMTQFSSDQLAQIAVSSGIGPSTIQRAARSQLLQQELEKKLDSTGTPTEQSQALRDALAKVAADLGVSVNPRFGSWDPKTAQVGPRDTERLSSPEPVPASGVGGLPVIPRS